MTKVSPDLLNNTYNLLQLARETALSRGQQSQADRLAPVADDLRELVQNTRQAGHSSSAQQVNPALGVLGQSDFQVLLNAAQSKGNENPAPPSTVERNQVVKAMLSAGMPDMDVARQMGMTRDEVRLISDVNRMNQNSRGIRSIDHD